MLCMGISLNLRHGHDLDDNGYDLNDGDVDLSLFSGFITDQQEYREHVEMSRK